MTGKANDPTLAERSLALDVAGLPTQLRFSREHGALADEVADLWSHLRVEQNVPADPLVITFVTDVGPTPAYATRLAPHAAATYTLSGHVTRSVIRRLIGKQLLLHAGAVETPELGTVVVVGESGAGKSTATVHLGQNGNYLSDELTIIDPRSFEVTGYPKPVSRAIPGSRVKRDFAPYSLGLTPARTGSSPSKIVLLGRRDGTESTDITPTTLERVSLAEGLLALISQSSSLWRVPGGLASLASLVEASGGVLRARYREAAELPRLLAAGTEAGKLEQWEPIGASPTATSPAQGELAIAPFEQALSLEAGYVILSRREAVYLEGLSALVWDILRMHGVLDLESLGLEVAGQLGAHPESDELVAAAVNALIASGWILRG